MMKNIFAVLLLASVFAAGKSESDHENSKCKCVPYYKCNAGSKTNTDSQEMPDLREGTFGTINNPNSKTCDNYLHVCCPEEDLSPDYEAGKAPEPSGNSENDDENSDCKCVRYYQCNADGTINTDGLGLIDIMRRGSVGTVDKSKKKKCDNYLDVCCPKKKVVSG